MKGRGWGEVILFNISRFLSFYLVIALVTSSTMMLFLESVELEEAMVRENAVPTFLYTIVMALIGCAFDEFRRHRTIDRPLERIMDALNKITAGDFSVRLDENHRDFSQIGFRVICIGINQMAQELGSVETLRTDFITSVSHELKTPLAAAGNYATLLKNPALTPEKRMEYAQAISDTTKRLAELVSNILKLNKLENQQIYPETRVFDLGEQLSESLLSFESLWEEKSLDLDCEIPDGVMVEADPELLRLVWSNLFSNAIKFTPEGGKIGVKLALDGAWASVAVSDTGCGMSREVGAHIFEKFYQGDPAHATKGNGLGLALVKRVVDITGGAITVQSAPGKGSTFTVRIGRMNDGTV